MKKRKFWMLIVTIMALLMLSGCKENQEELEKQKALSEIHFLENRCISILSKYISGDYMLKTGDFDWDSLKEEYVVLNNSISVILIDFASFQVPSQEIVQLENNFSDLNTFLQNQEQDLLIQKLCETYQFISTEIVNYFPIEDSVKQEKEVKSKALYLGYELSAGHLEEALQKLDAFQESYNRFSKQFNYIEDNSYKINRIFVDIQKIRNYLEKNDFENSKNVLLEILQEL